jgi:hypothetical protein
VGVKGFILQNTSALEDEGPIGTFETSGNINPATELQTPEEFDAQRII